VLENYVAGHWRRPEGDGAPLPHAATGDEVARVSDRPVPAADALAHARTAGRRTLQSLTFHERAALLKQLGLHLMGVKEQFHELSSATGATLGDSAIDLDGGFGTLLTYASKGRRELPDGRVHLDGPVEQLGRRGTFVARHLMTPLRGAAVQINACNFPVWGMLEKFAPAFLAGVPSVVKPASQTAYLTEQVVRSIIDSGLLPEGSLQLLVGHRHPTHLRPARAPRRGHRGPSGRAREDHRRRSPGPRDAHGPAGQSRAA
jgi:oxepin-CoA hydrolase/3-oxo-5,6-dehydrosuberyl-CoA semialdehyde dehydrogenase